MKHIHAVLSIPLFTLEACICMQIWRGAGRLELKLNLRLHAVQARSLFAFQSGYDELADVAWCPGNSTAFVTVTSRGCIEVAV